jgi:ADP-ribosylation factor GTPase-activating protein 1
MGGDAGRSTPGAGSGNEAYFERLGSANHLRPDNLPPSQGGKYAGFGSTPEPEPSSSHPAYGMSSHAAPTFDDFQRNPLGALSKGWGLFSTAVASAGREINESVVKPGVSRAQEAYDQGASDDVKRAFNNASTSARGAAGWMGQRASEGWGSVNDVARTRGGVDLNEQFGRLGLGKGSAHDQGYGQVGHDSPTNDSFFESWGPDTPGGDTPVSATASKPSAGSKSAAKKKDDWEDDEWKDF